MAVRLERFSYCIARAATIILFVAKATCGAFYFSVHAAAGLPVPVSSIERALFVEQATRRDDAPIIFPATQCAHA
jgi:hypothetical protein